MSSTINESSYVFLKELLETPSPSGFERGGQRVWSDFVAPHADAVESDPYGNVFATLNPEGSPRVLLAGHGDELGLMVTHINDEGFLFFKGIGGVDRGLLRGQRVVVAGRSGPVRGVVGHLAIHMQEPDDRKKTPEFHELFIDVGASGRDEAARLVRVGDPVTIEGGVWRLAGDRIAARGCDNRIGTWAAAEALRLLRGAGRACTAQVVAVSTVQEENGLYGATMVGYRLRPMVALVVDVTHATDIPACSKPKHGDIKMGSGPVISLGSSNHPVVCERLLAVAERKKIPCQVEANPRSTGTDADAIFLQRGGIPTVSLGLPNRYMHSPVEVIDLRDLEAMARLLAAFCESLERDEAFRVMI
jgi:putative aminopeptidase FrvX